MERRLLEAGIEQPQAESWFLMEAFCGIDRNFYYLHNQEEMPKEQFNRYEQMTDRRCSHVPLQYLTGSQEFMGLAFEVNPYVLIPRQDTEVLVETVLEKLKPGMQVLDLCTGSGCIAVSLKHYVPDCCVTASDVSEQALDTAKKNGKNHEADIAWVHSDLFEKIQGSFDVIVSNPPYIPSAVIETLMPEVRKHEPMSALDGTEDGLYFYRKITEESVQYVKDGGFLCYEIGHDQGACVSKIMKDAGYKNVSIIRDLAGLDRVVTGRRA